MRRIALGFLIGTIVLQQLSVLPDFRWSWWLLILIPLMFFVSHGRMVLAIAIGLCWANIFGHAHLSASLDPALEGEDLVVRGVVASLPETNSRRTRFQFVPDSLRRLEPGQDGSVPQTLPGKLLLNWYRDVPELEVGARWQLQVRLKQPHGFMNPGGFDYEAWLFAQGIRATGYVRGNYVRNKPGPESIQRLSAPADDYLVDQFRQRLRTSLNAALEGEPLRGIVLALAMGDRQQISAAQWETLTRTGTSHLVAISGLHVGLVAAFAFFAMQRGWRLLPKATLHWPAAKAGALAALLAATSYALLAGFSVPTQRALVMIAVLMLGIVLQRRTRPGDLLSLAMIVVLIMDPFSVLSAGFWLSFAAVAIILYGMQDRPASGANGWQRGWWRWGRVQCLVALGLLPLLVVLFQKASLVAPLANLLAVPWVSLISVPLTLLGTVALWFSTGLGFSTGLAETLLTLAAWSLEFLWWLLEWLGSLRYAQWERGASPAWVVICALLGIAWLLLPRGLPARWVGIVWLLPLVLWRPEPMPHGEAHFALLDVGQGLAAVVQTRSHVLVFDTGPRFSSGFNAGDAVLAPYLRQRGVTVVNTLVVSHGDNDHIGGAAALARQMSVQLVLTSVTGKLSSLSPELDVKNCHAGQEWWWDGVYFEMLSPHQAGKGRELSGNNRSCVLRVVAGGQSALLTGDIERKTEMTLVNHAVGQLDTDILVVPHHGSATSSSERFLDAVSPQLALFALGHRNRFGFPKPQVVARYQARDIQMLDSARYGAIELHLGAVDSLRKVSTFRQKNARYWHHQYPATGTASEQSPASGKSVSLLQ